MLKAPPGASSEASGSDDGRSSRGSSSAAGMESSGSGSGSSAGAVTVSATSAHPEDDDGLQEALEREKAIDDRLAELRAR